MLLLSLRYVLPRIFSPDELRHLDRSGSQQAEEAMAESARLAVDREVQLQVQKLPAHFELITFCSWLLAVPFGYIRSLLIACDVVAGHLLAAPCRCTVA